MSQDLTIVIGTVLWVLLGAVYWILQSVFRAEMKRVAPTLNGNSALRIGHIAASHVMLRCLWTGATFIAAVSFGTFFADPVNELISPVIPVSLMPTYALISLVIFVRLAFIWWERISIVYDDIFKPKSDPET